MLLLRALWDAMASLPNHAGPLPPFEETWRLLVEAERVSPEALDDVLMHPHAGAWAGHLLRRVRGIASDPAPLWASVGYFHALTAAAAIRAGVEFSTRIPAHDGVVVLPTLGFAWLPSRDGWQAADVEANSSGARIRLDNSIVRQPAASELDTPGWFGLRRLHAEVDGQHYTLAVDDLDPYREPGRVLAPRRLTDGDFEWWRRCFDSAWELLVRHHHDLAVVLPAGLTTVVPRPAVPGMRPYSGTAEESFGSTTISLPPDPTTFSVSLLHEFQHTKLGALLHLLPMYEGDGEERLYAPWRPDPRAAPSLLQGVYAFLGVTAFWRTQRLVTEAADARLAGFEYAHWRGQTWLAWELLRERSGLTELGHQFVRRMGDTMRPWQVENVPDDIQAAADRVAHDHRATWRIRHVRPSVADVSRIADAYLNDRPRPVLLGPERVAEAANCRPQETRSVLTRLRTTDPAAFRKRLERPEPHELADLVPGDVEYLTGYYDVAVRTYCEQIATDPNRYGAWVGLGLVLAAAGKEAAASALLRRPELVAAAYGEILLRDKGAPPDPVALATWLGR